MEKIYNSKPNHVKHWSRASRISLSLCKTKEKNNKKHYHDANDQRKRLIRILWNID